jgi:excisionase family DNA binding protein
VFVSGISITLDGLDGEIEKIVRRIVAERLEEIEPTVLDVARAAAYLNCSQGHLRRLVREGKLPDRRDVEGARLYFTKADLNAAVCPSELA